MSSYSNVFLKTLRDRRRSTVIVSVSIFVAGLYVSLLFPEFGASASISELLDQLPDWWQNLIGDAVQFGTPEGFFTTQPYSFLGAAIMIAFSIFLGQTAIAGEEEANTLDQLAANPVSRTRIYAEKTLAMMVSLMAPVLAVALSLLVGSWVRGYDFSYSGLAAQSFSLLMLSLTVGGLALSIGAATGSKGQSIAIASAVAGIGYLLNIIAPLVSWLEPTQYVSVIYYYIGGMPFVDGLTPWHAAVLVAITVISIVIGGLAFNRRDLQ